MIIRRGVRADSSIKYGRVGPAVLSSPTGKLRTYSPFSRVIWYQYSVDSVLVWMRSVQSRIPAPSKNPAVAAASTVRNRYLLPTSRFNAELMFLKSKFCVSSAVFFARNTAVLRSGIVAKIFSASFAVGRSCGFSEKHFSMNVSSSFGELHRSDAGVYRGIGR